MKKNEFNYKNNNNMNGEENMNNVLDKLIKIAENNTNAIVAQTESNNNILSRLSMMEKLSSEIGMTIVDHDNRIKNVEDHVDRELITPSQSRAITKAVNEKMKELYPDAVKRRMFSGIARSRLYDKIYEVYDINEKGCLPNKYFKECIERIQNWYPDGGLESIENHYYKTHKSA